MWHVMSGLVLLAICMAFRLSSVGGTLPIKRRLGENCLTIPSDESQRLQ